MGAVGTKDSDTGGGNLESLSIAGAEPFIRWLGGKRWMLNQYPDLFPKTFGCYYEPFLGGGAVLLALAPIKAVVGDINADLVKTFRQIRTIPGRIQSELARLHRIHSDEVYYNVRDGKHPFPLSAAAKFIYLNRTCFNGVYRVNQQGRFNVPIGTKRQVLFPDESFTGLASQLQSTEFRVCDFESLVDASQKGDFVFLDPPYVTAHNLNGFLKYNERIFAWDDQIRLKHAMMRARSRGVKMLLTNADHSSVRELFADVGDMVRLERSSSVASNPLKRSATSELAIKINY